MPYVEFTDAQAFSDWHDARCKELGIPRPGENVASGDVALDAQWTTALAEPATVDGVLVALVSDDDAKGLTSARKAVAQKIATIDGIIDPTPVFVKAVFEATKPVPTDKLDIAVILVDRAIRTKEEAVELLKVDPVALDTALAEVSVAVDEAIPLKP